MRWSILLLTCMVWRCAAQDAAPAPAPVAESAAAATTARADFQIRYVNGSDVYIDGGRDSGLAEGTQLVLKQDAKKSGDDAGNKAVDAGVVAKLTVVSVASMSAVCEVTTTSRDLVSGDVVSLPDTEVAKITEKNALGNTRQYPMVISFTEGDPLEEEVRNTIPRPPLPEINQIRGRIGFDYSMIQQLGQGGVSSYQYGGIFRADFTRIFGTHWNLNGYWRGELRSSKNQSQATLQDVMNRTYLMSLTYINPDSHWTAGVGRLYIPWANSLETIDGAYVADRFASHALTGIFAGSTPDPTAWNYNPDRRIGGALLNMHGGSFDDFHYSSTFGAGVEMLKWVINRPFAFTENNLSYKRYFSLYQAAQVDRPSSNPAEPAVGTGLGQSLISLRVQAHPRIALDLTDTYFRDVPTYDPTLVGTGLLDKYLYQGINGGARIQFPYHVAGYFTIGSSSNSSDPKNSLNRMFGASMSNIWKTGLEADARYAKFDSVFASGTYTTITISRDMLDNLRLNLQLGRYAYTSSFATNSASDFVNLLFETNLGARMFVESMFTAQRGGSLDYNQWTTTLGYRFDNRAAERRRANANLH